MTASPEGPTRARRAQVRGQRRPRKTTATNCMQSSPQEEMCKNQAFAAVPAKFSTAAKCLLGLYKTPQRGLRKALQLVAAESILLNFVVEVVPHLIVNPISVRTKQTGARDG